MRRETFLMKYNEVIYALRWRYNMCKTKIYWKGLFGMIGARSTICNPLLLNRPDKIFLGNHVRIREMARLEAITEYNGTKFEPRLEIGDDTGFEQGLHMTCAEDITIGKQVTVLAYVMIQDCTHEYEDVEKNILDQKLITKPVKIGDGCFIGLGARILPGVTLGKHCIVGSNAVVLGGDYEAYSVLVGNPAKCVKRYDIENRIWRKTNSEGKFIDGEEKV